MDLILNSLEFFDKNREKYELLIRKYKYYKIVDNPKDLEHSLIVFYDANKKKIGQSRFEVLGQYFNSNRLWMWAWGNPNFEKNKTYLSKKILNYGLDLEPDAKSLFLKTELVTSRFRVSDFLQLDIHSSIASYISKVEFIFPIIYIPTFEMEEFKIADIYIQKKIMEDNKDFEIMYLFLLDE